MTLLTHCGKALLALDDMEQVVHYLKAEVTSCTAHIYTHTTHIHDACHFVHAASEEVRIRDRPIPDTVNVGYKNAGYNDNRDITTKQAGTGFTALKPHRI